MGSCGNVNGDEVACNGFHIIRHTPFQLGGNRLLSWFDIRVFYVRVSHLGVDDSTPESLALNHVPLDPDTLLEVNGQRCGINSDGISSVLRRDRLDKRSEEVTFVSTDNVRFTGSMKFQVFNREDLVLSGVLELCNNNGNNGEQQNLDKRWSLRFESEVVACSNFLKMQYNGRPECDPPTIEVYVAGCFSGAPIILTKTLQLNNNTRRKNNRKVALNAIPEHEMAGTSKDPKNLNSLNSASPGLDLQEAGYTDYKMDEEEELNLYWRNREYMEGEDSEVSWFNAGVRVGVGIGLGVCIGVGLGVGLLVRTYQTTTRTFRRRFL